MLGKKFCNNGEFPLAKNKYLLENELKQLAANLLRKLEVVRQYSCIA